MFNNNKPQQICIVDYCGSGEDPANKQLCGQPVKLLHFPGFPLRRMKYVQWLLRWWTGVSGDDSLSEKWDAANFRSDTRDVVEVDALGQHVLRKLKN